MTNFVTYQTIFNLICSRFDQDFITKCSAFKHWIPGDVSQDIDNQQW